MIRTFTSLDELSAAAADAFCKLAGEAIESRGVFRVTLSGGSTPRGLYETLATRAVPWEHIELFWGDERNVPHDHEQSNYRMVREALLDHLPRDQVRVIPVPVDPGDPVATATAYEATIRARFPEQSHPAWDLALLGMGDDAHTASLFPDTEALTRTDRWFVENFVPKFDAYRYTLTAPAINSARNRLFLVAGASKRDALAKVVSDNEHNPTRYPAQLIESPQFYVTADAAGHTD